MHKHVMQVLCLLSKCLKFSKSYMECTYKLLVVNLPLIKKIEKLFVVVLGSEHIEWPKHGHQLWNSRRQFTEAGGCRGLNSIHGFQESEAF